MIRKMPLQDALDQLRYSKRRVATWFMKALNQLEVQAVAKGLNAEHLHVGICHATKHKTIKGVIFHGRGRTGRKQV